MYRRIPRKRTKTDATPLEHNLTNSLDDNLMIFKDIFKDDETIVFRDFGNQNNKSVRCTIILADGMVKPDIISENIVSPITKAENIEYGDSLLLQLKGFIIASTSVIKTKDIDAMIEAVISGDTLLLVEGEAEALIIASKGWEKRAIEEPQSEKVLRGPREGFTESIMTNISMIRRKIQNSNLKFKFKILGKQTKTKASICYIEGIANEQILKEVYKRLDDIDIDGLLDTGYIQELIRDSRFSPFRTIGTTERPDVVAGKILEGRIAIILDGTPVVLTIPFLFMEFFQAPDDYYNNFYFTSISRLIRIIAFVLTISVPAIYLALITFHQEMIPTDLLLSVSAARQGTPFPSVIEALGLLLIFEILRETGTRMPSYIGQALSIVGALVLGQAAVEARFVSAPMVIIVGLSGITGLITPKVKGAVIIIRLFLLILASFIGLYGILFGITIVLIHILNIRSFGVMYMGKIGESDAKENMDTAVRMPWWYMTYRPWFANRDNRKRQSKGGS